MWTSEHRRRARVIVAVAIVSTVIAGCGSDDDGSSEEATLAQQLVDATTAAGVAPRLTVDVAESLYGTDAPAVCDAFAGGLSTSGANLILGNPGHGRRKTITDDAIEYGRLVVQTYCPQYSTDYDDAVNDLDPFEKSAS